MMSVDRSKKEGELRYEGIELGRKVFQISLGDQVREGSTILEKKRKQGKIIQQ